MKPVGLVPLFFIGLLAGCTASDEPGHSLDPLAMTSAIYEGPNDARLEVTMLPPVVSNWPGHETRNLQPIHYSFMGNGAIDEPIQFVEFLDANGAIYAQWARCDIYLDFTNTGDPTCYGEGIRGSVTFEGRGLPGLMGMPLHTIPEEFPRLNTSATTIQVPEVGKCLRYQAMHPIEERSYPFNSVGSFVTCPVVPVPVEWTTGAPVNEYLTGLSEAQRLTFHLKSWNAQESLPRLNDSRVAPVPATLPLTQIPSKHLVEPSPGIGRFSSARAHEVAYDQNQAYRTQIDQGSYVAAYWGRGNGTHAGIANPVTNADLTRTEQHSVMLHLASRDGTMLSFEVVGTREQTALTEPRWTYEVRRHNFLHDGKTVPSRAIEQAPLTSAITYVEQELELVVMEPMGWAYALHRGGDAWTPRTWDSTRESGYWIDVYLADPASDGALAVRTPAVFDGVSGKLEHISAPNEKISDWFGLSAPWTT